MNSKIAEEALDLAVNYIKEKREVDEMPAAAYEEVKGILNEYANNSFLDRLIDVGGDLVDINLTEKADEIADSLSDYIELYTESDFIDLENLIAPTHDKDLLKETAHLFNKLSVDIEPILEDLITKGAVVTDEFLSTCSKRKTTERFNKMLIASRGLPGESEYQEVLTTIAGKIATGENDPNDMLKALSILDKYNVNASIGDAYRKLPITYYASILYPNSDIQAEVFSHFDDDSLALHFEMIQDYFGYESSLTSKVESNFKELAVEMSR